MAHFYLTPDAKDSLRSIALYTQRRWGEKQRHDYLKALDKCFHDLAASPRRGKPRPEIHHGLYSRPEGSHVIYYLIQKDVVVIVNILHQRMDYEKHLSLK